MGQHSQRRSAGSPVSCCRAGGGWRRGSGWRGRPGSTRVLATAAQPLRTGEEARASPSRQVGISEGIFSEEELLLHLPLQPARSRPVPSGAVLPAAHETAGPEISLAARTAGLPACGRGGVGDGAGGAERGGAPTGMAGGVARPQPGGAGRCDRRRPRLRTVSAAVTPPSPDQRDEREAD